MKESRFILSFLLVTISFFTFSQSKNEEVNNQNINELIGTWKLKKKLDSEEYSNIKFTKFIKIDQEQIIFYNNPNQVEYRVDLKINNFRKTYISAFPSLQIDKEIWYFSIKDVNGQRRLRLKKIIDKNGNLSGRIDERAIIINKKEREKALKKEIDTYYIKK